jgi:Mo25-like
MSFMYFKKKKTPKEIINCLADDLDKLIEFASVEDEANMKTIRDDIEKRVMQMYTIVFGDSETRNDVDEIDQEAIDEIAKSCEEKEIWRTMLTHFKLVDFEVRRFDSLTNL